MWNKKQYVRAGLLCERRPPRGQAWCSCKFQKLRYTIIRIACDLIEALECKCEKPKWTDEDHERWLRANGFIQEPMTDEEYEAISTLAERTDVSVPYGLDNMLTIINIACEGQQDHSNLIYMIGGTTRVDILPD